MKCPIQGDCKVTFSSCFCRASGKFHAPSPWPSPRRGEGISCPLSLEGEGWGEGEYARLRTNLTMSYHKQHHLQDADVPQLEAFFIPLKKMCIKSSLSKGGPGGIFLFRGVTGQGENPPQSPFAKGGGWKGQRRRHPHTGLLPQGRGGCKADLRGF